MQLTIMDELKALIPPLSADEYTGLEQSIIAEGCRDAITVWLHDGDNVIVDGHNRYAICSAHGLPYQTVTRDFDSLSDVKLWMIRNQLSRRNLTPFKRGELALQMEAVIAERARMNMAAGGKGGLQKEGLANLPDLPDPINTRDELARVAEISSRNVHKIKQVLSEAPAPIIEQARKGEISIHNAYETTVALRKVEPEKRQEVLDKVARGEASSVKEAQQAIKKAEDIERRVERAAELASEAKPMPEREYMLIYADPPWRYDFSATSNREIENHYPTMSIEDICALKPPAAKDCVLFMWATNPKLVEAFQVIQAWGFEYVTNMVWVKDKIGMGYYARQQHELLLIAKRGNGPVPEPANRPPSVIEATRGVHSRKPEQMYDMLDRMYPGLPKIELFSRTPRQGWASWGYEADEQL